MKTRQILNQVHNNWAHESGDLSGSTAILSTFQDGVLVMAGVGDSGKARGGDGLLSPCASVICFVLDDRSALDRWRVEERRRRKGREGERCEID